MTSFRTAKALYAAEYAVKLASKDVRTENDKSNDVARGALIGTGLGTLGGYALTTSGGKLLVRTAKEQMKHPKHEAEYKKTLKNAKKLGIEVVEGGDPSSPAHGLGPRMELRKNKYRRIVLENAKNDAILSHELGHATGTDKIIKSLGPLRTLGIIPGVAAGFSGISALRSQSGEEREKSLERTRNFGLGYVGLAHAPTLLEEARATGKSLLSSKNSKQALRRLKVLAPAYGTYVGAALPALSVPITAEILRRREKARRGE
jgi:hypothetical protein